MQLYFAGASKQRAFIAQLAARAELQGHTITVKWWVNYHERHNTFHVAAGEDLGGVLAADVLVMIVDDVLVSPGAHVELGFALALRKPVLAICANVDKTLAENIWLHLDCIRVVQMDDEINASLATLNHELMLAQRAANLAPAMVT